MNAYRVAEQFQSRRNDQGGFFYASDILGSDWTAGINGFDGVEHYRKLAIERAESIYGALPFNPFDD